MHPSNTPYRRIVVVSGVILSLVMALMPSSSHADATWPRSQFWIHAPLGVTDTTRLRFVNNADIDIVANVDGVYFGHRDSAIKLAQNLDALASPAFDLKCILNHTKPQNAFIITGNSDAKCNATYIAQSLCLPDYQRACVKGFGVWDEPCSVTSPYCLGFGSAGYGDTASTFPRIRDITNLIHASPCHADKLPNTNLFPYHLFTFTGPEGRCADSYCGGNVDQKYRCYLDQYLSLFKSNALPAPMLSVDHYPFEGGSTTDPGYVHYFNTLKAMQEKSMEYGRGSNRVPMWMLVQIGRNTLWPNGVITPEKIRWQVYASVAYGAKGIGYFPLDNFLTYKGGMFDDQYEPTANYAFLTALNDQLHKLGPTLVQLDPVVVYHQATTGFSGISGDLLSSPNRVYNVVNTMTGGASMGMVGYFKHRLTGEDYLLVMNKDVANSQTFSITLTNSADSVLIVSKTTGVTEFVTAGTTFSTGAILPGEGQLYKIVDKTDEYIPNINAMAIKGDRTYYAHQKGVVVVNTVTGRRTHYTDGTAFTPVVDIAVDNSHVFVALNNGSTGGLLRSQDNDMDLAQFMQPFGGSFGSLPTSIALTSTRIYAGYKAANNGNSIVAFNRTTYARTDSVKTNTFATPVNDIEYQPGVNKLAAINGSKIQQFDNNLAKVGSGKSVSSPVKLAANSAGFVYVACNGSNNNGKLRKANQALTSFLSAFSSPTAKYIAAAVNSSDTRVLSGETTTGTFKWHDATTGAALSSVNLSVTPRAVYVSGTNIAYLASSAGLRKHSFGSTEPQRFAAARPSSTPFSLSLRPHPVRGEATVRLTLPRAGMVSLRAFDVMGRGVRKIVEKQLPAGMHEIQWETRSLRPGVYFLRLQMGKELTTRRVVIAS